MAPERTAQRRNEILEKIRSGLEMDVELSTEIYSSDRPLPKGSRWLRFWLSLHRLDFPYLTFFSACMIRRFLPSSRCQFVPGFRCLVGNIVCDGASLFETCFVDYAAIYVGRGTGFSYQNLVITSTHDMEDMNTVLAREIVIGENVWITSRVTILPCVHIGRNSVIDAGSIVS
ncbi:MAG: acyltransferase [Bacteroidota bacterium]